MNEILIDQIPNLSMMLRALEELSLMAVGGQVESNALIVQQMPEIRAQITKDKNWKKVAENNLKENFKDDEESMKEDVERMARLYDYNILEGLVEGFKCGACGKDATKRCSKCKWEFYCSRECQVIFSQIINEQLGHWKDHKPICLAKTSELERLNKPKEKDNEIKNSSSSGSRAGLVTEINNENETKAEKTKREEVKLEPTEEKQNPLNDLD